MIASLNGKLLSKSTNYAVIDCMGVGYYVNISISTFEKLPEIGTTLFLFIVFQIREDDISLYGFLNELDKEAFLILNSVSGIGGKTALGILSSVSVTDLAKFIMNQNTNALKKLPGIGPKTADRLCFELKDKILHLQSYELDISGSYDNTNFLINEATSALVALGYSKNIAEKAVKAAAKTLDDDVKVESLIKVALKYTQN